MSRHQHPRRTPRRQSPQPSYSTSTHPRLGARAWARLSATYIHGHKQAPARMPACSDTHHQLEALNTCKRRNTVGRPGTRITSSKRSASRLLALVGVGVMSVMVCPLSAVGMSSKHSSTRSAPCPPGPPHTRARIASARRRGPVGPDPQGYRRHSTK